MDQHPVSNDERIYRAYLRAWALFQSGTSLDLSMFGRFGIEETAAAALAVRDVAVKNGLAPKAKLLQWVEALLAAREE